MFQEKQKGKTESMLARKPITTLIVSALSFLPVIKVLSILCTVIFVLN